MINQLFLGFTLLGAQWVLWVLILLSVVSVSLILERWNYFRLASKTLEHSVVDALKSLSAAEKTSRGLYQVEALMGSAKLNAERRLNWLSTIGANAPFVGLFGTVLGIIKAFHDLSTTGSQASSAVSSGISEALVATAVGLFVAIPAVVAYNYFQKRVKDMLLSAEVAKNKTLGEK